MGISLKEVNYAYIKGKNALENINIDINSNDEFISIVGETGSGKSTLASIFNLLKVPTSGKVIINDKLINQKRKIKYNEIRKHVGLVFQFSDYQLFDETVLKDVSFGPKNFGYKKDEAINKAKEALRLVEMDESFYERSPFELSGGEKRLAAIAGILACDTDIVVFDEPTSGLDAYKKKNLLNLIRKINKEEHKTVIVITHDMNIALEYSNRIILLNKGKIVIDTTPTDLFKNHIDLVKENNINLPDSIRLRDELNNRLGMNLNKVYKTIDELIEDIK